MIDNASLIVSQLSRKKDEYEFNKQKLDELILEKEKLSNELQVSIDTQKKYQQVLDATKITLERLTFENKGRLENFVTYGLNQIFPDRHYVFKLLIKEDSKRPGIDILLVEDGIEQEITDAVGGGILSTIGLLMQIYYLEIYGKSKIMFMDESLSAISKNNEDDSASVSYLNNVIGFLSYLSKNRGYKFVIVTHENKVMDLADSIYSIKLGKVEHVK